MSHTQSPTRRALHNARDAARRERTATRREARKLKRIETGAFAAVAPKHAR